MGYYAYYRIYYLFQIFHIRRYSIRKNDEILDLFNENTEDFNNFVNLLKETDVLDKLKQRWYFMQEHFTQPPGDTLNDPSRQLKNSGFVTKEQLKTVQDFFEKYNPHHVYVTNYFATCYEFNFFSKENCVNLVYIDSDDDEEIEDSIEHMEHFGHDVFHLSGSWYCELIDKL